MPEIPELRDLYGRGKTKIRHGQVVMIAGRSGTQKSGFALWLCQQWGLPTLYFSADMSAFTASARLASMATGYTTEEVEAMMLKGGRERDYCLDALKDSRIQFSFGSPLTWQAIDEELQAYIELWDAYPEVIVFDNLMDFEGAAASYEVQMDVMVESTSLARATGALTMVLHHATDKGQQADANPFEPPPKSAIKNGVGEKPEQLFGVALDANTMEYRIATLKQREGPCDPSGQKYITLRAQPELTRFHTREWRPDA